MAKRKGLWFLIPFRRGDSPRVKAAYRRELGAKEARGPKGERGSAFKAKSRAHAQAKLDAAAERIILTGG